MEPEIKHSQSKRRGRPRLLPHESETRQKLVRAGLALLTERGYSAVGLDEILTNAGVPKGGFYHYFPSKAAFALQLMDEYDRYFSGKLNQAFARTDLTPIERLEVFMTDAENGMRQYCFRRGCLVGNLGQEMNALPQEFRERIIAILAHWQALTAANFANVHANPEALAEYFWIGWEGAVLRAKLEHNEQALRCFAQGFLKTYQYIGV